MHIDFLSNHQQAIPILADWYFKEWGYLTKDNSLEKVTEKLYEYLNTDKIPLIIPAMEADEIIGAVQLKFREMTLYPDREHWIGGIYVRENYRGIDVLIMKKEIHWLLFAAHTQY